MPFSTRPSDLEVSTAGGAGLPGALITNRGVSLDRTADADVTVKVSGDFGAVRAPTLVRFEAFDLDNGDDVVSSGDFMRRARRDRTTAPPRGAPAGTPLCCCARRRRRAVLCAQT